MTPSSSTGSDVADLRVAARINLWMFVACYFTLVVVAGVMFVITTAIGSPVSKEHPPLVATVAFAAFFWGLVLVGVGSLILMVVRFRQASAERAK